MAVNPKNFPKTLKGFFEELIEDSTKGEERSRLEEVFYLGALSYLTLQKEAGKNTKTTEELKKKLIEIDDELKTRLNLMVDVMLKQTIDHVIGELLKYSTKTNESSTVQ